MPPLHQRKEKKMVESGSNAMNESSENSTKCQDVGSVLEVGAAWLVWDIVPTARSIDHGIERVRPGADRPDFDGEHQPQHSHSMMKQGECRSWGNCSGIVIRRA